MPVAKTKYKRKALSVKLRFDVFKRDGFVCQYCGLHPPQAVLHVDHIVPVSKGGTNDEENLITACDHCNLGKGARSLSDIPKSLANKAAETAEREEQIRGYSEIMSAKRERVEDDCWKVAEVFMDHFCSVDNREIRKDWFQSIKRFVKELGADEVIDAMEMAIARQPNKEYMCFKYFCGICWRKIKDDL